MPFLTEDSLDVSLAKAAKARKRLGEPPPLVRTARRSDSAHYGCIRHALMYLLRSHGVTVSECKRVSLLLRLQMYRLAQHDLQFVRSVSTAASNRGLR